MAGVYHEPLKVRLIYQDFKQSFPCATISPANKPTVSIAPSAKVRRKVSPGGARSHDPEYGIDEQAIVLRYAAPTALPTRQVRLKFLPHFV